MFTGVADADVDAAEVGVALYPVEHVPDVVVLLQVALDSEELSAGSGSRGFVCIRKSDSNASSVRRKLFKLGNCYLHASRELSNTNTSYTKYYMYSYLTTYFHTSVNMGYLLF
jgi:hypothetical protein